MQPRNVSGTTMMPNSRGTVRGSKSVPNISPSADDITQVSGAIVINTSQLNCKCTGVAGTNLAIGNTMIAATRHCAAPATIFSTATSSTGNGASTRSSISFV